MPSGETLGGSLPSRLAWRLLRDEPRSGSRNMALDHALALRLAPSEGVVRLYGWERPTVSLGRNEPAKGLYTLEAMASAGVGAVRRPTGGRAVLHWRELTYAVVAPVDAWGGLREAYFGINLVLAEAIRGLGAPAEVVGGRAPTPLDAGPCFQAPAAGEIVVRGRKLVGSAQMRLEGALLQHGSILLDDDQGLLGRLRTDGPGNRAAPESVAPATLRAEAGHVGIDDLTDAVAMSLRGGFGGTWGPEGYRSSEIETADRLEAERYACDSWTWRR
ncbi:MAG: biotin/lipoate A/B protein ligase family protein [Gemmatimonadota bacterium]